MQLKILDLGLLVMIDQTKKKNDFCLSEKVYHGVFWDDRTKFDAAQRSQQFGRDDLRRCGGDRIFNMKYYKSNIGHQI